MKKIILLAVCSLLLSTGLYAKVKPVAHYNFGRSGNVSFASAPDQLTPEVGKGALTAVGSPLFYADAPKDKAMKGEGSILFSGKGDGYQGKQAFGTPKENMVLEVWVKPRDAEKNAIIVANGNGKEGYTFWQRGHTWMFNSGGSGSLSFGEVIKGQWVHLAAVVDKEKGSVWLNGKKMGTFNPTKAIAPFFSIALSEEGKDPFNGEVYEVRYSTFANGTFNADTDFLLNYKVLKEKNKNREAERLALIRQLQQPGLGKEIVSQLPMAEQKKDWLIQKVDEPCRMFVQKLNNESTTFQLSNGLVSRTFYVSENIACVGYRNLSNNAEFLRAVKPEARICVDSVWYEVGGLKGQPEMSYLLGGWYPQLEASEQAFNLSKVETGLPLMRYPWKPKHNAVPTDWPAKGLRVEMTYRPTESMPGVAEMEVRVNYEIYQGLPIMAKWIEVINHGEKKVVLNDMECEVLAVNQDQVPRMHVESDFSCALINADLQGSALMHYNGIPKPYHVGSSTTKWVVDTEYNTWASHNQAEDKFLNFPHHCLLLSKLPMGPSVVVSKEEPFKSYLTFELLQDSDDRERKTLGHRRLYKVLAPQTTESLITAGITSHDEKKLKSLIDQMSELGMERLDIQAWPGIDHEKLDSTYVQLWRTIANYAGERGIIVGGYELQVASRGRGKEVDCVHPETGKPGSLFGQSVCIASSWKDTYYKDMWDFYSRTGLKTYSMDGPYHGDPCASELHRHHRGLYDSQWEQWKSQVEVLHEVQRRGMYSAIPDWYFLNGQSSTGMGYREASSNLTQQQQQLIGRQYIYDGTWHKLPTMGWIGIQLVGFYTNDPRVGLEPLCENLDRYESQLIQFLGSGCQFTIRGNRMYDTPETKKVVAKWINWFKQYRDILTSEIIHVSRPTGRDLDCMMHVNPFIGHKGMVVVFNPTDQDMTKEMKLPLYYTGLKGKAIITGEDGSKKAYQLNGKEELTLPVSIKAGATTWFLIEE